MATVMTSVRISCNCGCGYKADTLEEAVTHCQATGHSMGILGTVSPERSQPTEYSQEEVQDGQSQ